jgi:hypothetical protein
MLTILAFGLWLGYRVNFDRNRNLAVAAVKTNGGWIHYADEFAIGPEFVFTKLARAVLELGIGQAWKMWRAFTKNTRPVAPRSGTPR